MAFKVKFVCVRRSFEAAVRVKRFAYLATIKYRDDMFISTTA